MPRPKKIETKELLRLVDEYRVNTGGELKIPEIGNFIRGKGIEVEDYLIRRNKEVKEYIDAINSQCEKQRNDSIIVYHPLDVDSFLDKNRTKDRLKEALTSRDTYYASVCTSAAEVLRKLEKVEKSCEQLKKENLRLKTQLEKKEKKEDSIEIKEKNVIIKKLMSILSTYVYPEAANALLESEGILKQVESIVHKDQLDAVTITADTDVSRFSSVGVNALYDMLE